MWPCLRRRALEAKKPPLKVAETRLANRSHRPNIEVSWSRLTTDKIFLTAYSVAAHWYSWTFSMFDKYLWSQKLCTRANVPSQIPSSFAAINLWKIHVCLTVSVAPRQLLSKFQLICQTCYNDQYESCVESVRIAESAKTAFVRRATMTPMGSWWARWSSWTTQSSCSPRSSTRPRIAELSWSRPGTFHALSLRRWAE